MNAKKEVYQAKEVEQLLEQVNQVYAAKGKKVVHFDLKKSPPDRETLLKAILGPTGNLRAPTLRQGKTLIVGFDQQTYDQLLK